MPPIKIPFWHVTRKFRIEVVGTSYYRDNIERIAQNPDGARALVLCVAELVPEDDNPHDANAIAVHIEGRKVGHLSREFAPVYRQLIAQIPNGQRTTAIYAAILNGLRTPEREYDYSIAVDLPDDYHVCIAEVPEIKTVRRFGYGDLERQPDGSYTTGIWVPVADRTELHPKLHVMEWTTDHWDTVNFYLQNRQGIGLGHKMGSPRFQCNK